ncbi:MAG: putative reverse transcriptase [Streblomastix strix]|uniref:Putative reverse transcriptase n=1 Tax=Streblomastix strix TaxID=222440 RepID=A0A5J4X4N4_9EUKA|nr:MAG: putative reverse transcriptase [Streblomastix strix]
MQEDRRRKLTYSPKRWNLLSAKRDLVRIRDLEKILENCSYRGSNWMGWKLFWREVDTDLYLDTVRMDLNEDDNHHHHHDHDHNYRYERKRNDRNDQLDLGRGRKRRGVISSEDNLGYDTIDENMPYLQCKQLRGLQFTCQVSEQLKKKFFAQRTISLLTLMKKALFVGQMQNQSIKKEDVTVNNTQSEQRQQIDVIDLEQNIQQQIEDIPRNEQGNINSETEQPTQTGAIHTPQTEAPDNLQPQQSGLNDNLNKMAEQNSIQPTQNFSLDSHLGPLFSQMNYPRPPRRTPDQSNTKLRSKQPPRRRQRIVSLTQTTPQSQTTPYPNQNQSLILNVDLMGIITNPFLVPKRMQDQQIAGEAAQVASSTDSIVSGQVGVAGTKPINIQTAHSTQLQGNPVREHKVEKKGGRTPVGMKTSSSDSQVRVPGRVQLMEIQNRTKEEIHTLEIFPRTPIEEVLQSQPDTGMGRKTIRYLETWKLVKGVEFIQKRFFLLFKNEDSEKRLQKRLRICPFSGSREETIAYTEKLEEELRENITEQIYFEQAKWFNPTFIIPKPHQKWTKILNAYQLNKEIQKIHFKMNGTDQVRDLIRKGDWVTSLDQKSAFHHLTVYPPHKPYLAFEAMGKVYQYRAMPFGTQHSPIFFAQALAMVLTKIRRESDIRILNYVDDLLLLHQNKERLRKQTLIIMQILEAFGWTIAQEKCEIEPKQQINFQERDIPSPLSSFVKNSYTESIRNRRKQTRGQVHGNKRGKRSQMYCNRCLILGELSDSEPGEGDDERERNTTTRKDRRFRHGPRVDKGRKPLTEFQTM